MPFYTVKREGEMKKVNLYLISISVVFCLSGCLRTQPIILTEEDRIFTLKTGTPVTLYLDKQKKDMVFPYDMKIVSPKILVRQEQRLNDEIIKRIKVTKEKNKWVGILGSLLTIVSGLMIYLKKKKK